MSAASARLLRLFIASYAPLGIILAVQESDGIWPPQNRPAFWLLLSVGMLGMADAFNLPRGALRKGHVRITLSRVTDEGGQVAAYIATYLLPFIGVDIGEWRDVLALLLYFSVLFVVFLRSDLALVNPALYLTGWRVVSGERDNQRVLMLVPQGKLVSTGEMYAVTFGNFLVYDCEAEQ